jgi:serine/threonine protein kinase
MFIEKMHDELSVSEKLNLCRSLSEGLKELCSLGYYHRDIKPDNIFIINDVWKIGDLGLLAERDKEDEIDRIGEGIGPKGWMSPESMNKYLCEGKKFLFIHNCNIDHQSDIFQLGKVFWYIFQYNAPIGTVKEKDFFIKNTRIYAVIKTMLNYSKKKRYKKIDEVIWLFKLIEAKMLKKMVA